MGFDIFYHFIRPQFILENSSFLKQNFAAQYDAQYVFKKGADSNFEL